ncbi:hypothetical protein BSKO_05274 [Bryopsis sp. KO-2023]|nr:hypothetical protein BSKO_05274 [Bryopsis sp. KO-2023]
MVSGSGAVEKHLDMLLPGLKMVKGWEEVEPCQVEITKLSASLSNHVYRCELKEAKGISNSVVLGRVYGDSGGLFDRELEVERFRQIHQGGVGPKLLVSLANCRIEEFLLDYKATSAGDIRSNRTSMYIAATMGEFHSKMLDYYKYNPDLVERPGEISLWGRIEDWYKIACTVNKPLITKLGLTDVLQQVEIMRSDFAQCTNKWVSFCHNDLQHGNVMKSTDEAHPGVKFIDFEFCGFNPIAFEIANHWSEWCCDYSSSQPHVIKHDRFPNKDQRYAFLHSYLDGLAKTVEDMGITRSDGRGGAAADAESDAESQAREKVNDCLTCLLDLIELPEGIDALHEQAMQFVAVSDLVCGLWAVIQDGSETGIDFDFREFATQKIKSYHKADLF